MSKKILLVSLMLAALVGMSAPALADDNSQATTTVPAVVNAPKLDVSCMATAVGVRETAVQSAFAAFSQAQTAALTSRQTALQSAWSMTDFKARKTAILAAWKTYRNAHRVAIKNHNKASSAAWKQFKTTSKSCNAKSGDDSGSSADDNMQ